MDFADYGDETALDDMISVSDLSMGDSFFEDTYPEIWTVFEMGVEQMGIVGIRARVTGTLDPRGRNPRLGEESWWGEAYPGVFCLFRVGN